MTRRRLPYAHRDALISAPLFTAEVAVNVSDYRLHIGDGVTQGGVPQARLSEVVAVQNDVHVVDQKTDVLSREIADLHESLASGVKGYVTFSDLPATETTGALARVADTFITYRFDGAEWRVFEIPDRLVREMPSAPGLYTTDENNFVIDYVALNERWVAGTTYRRDENLTGVSPVDRSGFRSTWIDETGAGIAGLFVSACDDERGIVITDRNNFLLARIDGGEEEEALPPDENKYFWDGAPFLTNKLCGVAGEEFPIYLGNILAVRGDMGSVKGYIGGTSFGSGYGQQGLDQINYRSDRMGSAGELVVYSDDPDVRRVKSFAVATAPKSPALGPVKILGIGDSIWNRQAAALVKRHLSDWGYTAQMIGTMTGEGATGVPGELGEGREGWRTGDYDYSLTEFGAVASGGEAAYLSLGTAAKRNLNPFIRAAVGGDPSSDIRNGQIMDFGFYQSRFGLQAPDVVLHGLGTNDIHAVSPAILFDTVYNSDRLFYRRIKAAWPNAKIIRFVPGVSRSSNRDAWVSRYNSLLRAVLAASEGEANVTVCPSWAMAPMVAGYELTSGTTDSVTKVKLGAVSDPVHPIGGVRSQLFRAVAAYVACAATNQI